jgi:hypothetical protein
MRTPGNTVMEILLNQPEDRVEPFNKLHDVIMKNLPKGFEAGTSYGGLGYVVAPYRLPKRIPLQIRRTPALCRHCFTKGSINFLPHGYLCRSQTVKVVSD